MKVAQLLATIPDALPQEYVSELAKLQSEAPPMGWAFVKRRMTAELGADWQSKFAEFEHKPAAAASLGQVHKARAHDGTQLACKLQYPDMQSAVEADLKQLESAVRPAPPDGAGDRHQRDQQGDRRAHSRGTGLLARGETRRALSRDAVEGPIASGCRGCGRSCRPRGLLTLDWLEGNKLLTYKEDDRRVATASPSAMFTAWWFPFSRFGVIHGDPHLGNYTMFRRGRRTRRGINLLDYGCIRIFPPRFVGGVVDLYHGLRDGDDAQVVHAYETWGFKNLSARTDRHSQYLGTLHLWPVARRSGAHVSPMASNPANMAAREAFRVHQALAAKGPVTVPREFVFMDRAAIGLGGVFLHLHAELNFYQLFNEAIENFSVRSGGVETGGRPDAGAGLEPPG